MAKTINHLDHPLTADERAYLNSRGRRSEILVNDRIFGDGGEGRSIDPESADVETDEETWEEYVGLMKVDELRAELAARDLDTSGNKAELQARLIEAGPDEDDD